ncbi:MAG TPA: Uma2 family endonuclease [Kofleriaceae bacterium]|nr:Uma2 family endonuclease [Kofleriaceae bacterium]
MYVALRDALDDQSGVKMTYLEGVLELMSPSLLHEEAKSIIARLLETWAVEHDIDLRAFGSTTFRREAVQRGLEPDECYVIGPLVEGGVPDIAIEVIVSNTLVDKMAVYAGLGVREVWTWRPETRAIDVHGLVDDHYESCPMSRVLPTLDLAELSRHVLTGQNQTQLIKAYQQALRGRSS